MGIDLLMPHDDTMNPVNTTTAIASSLQTDKFTCETITWLRPWTAKLFSFRITRPAHYRFEAGQWARLGVLKAGHTKPVWRAYSIVNATYEPYLEFYSIVVPNGEFTSELNRLAVGDTVLLEKMPYGFLTTTRFEIASETASAPSNIANTATEKPDLWLLSTGTGLAPFISILGDFTVWQDYARIIVVHGVRSLDELTYTDVIDSFKTHELFSEFFTDNASDSTPKKLIYQACVTREAPENLPTGVLQGRIPALLDNGALEASVGITVDAKRSRVMICGNPEMVDDTRAALKARGLTVSRSSKPGNIAVENYW
jgi:ferredoxin/flavodoxin---NADP+ reductase